MTDPAAGSLTQNLRVAIAARGGERIAALAKLLHSLGHEVVDSEERPDVVLAEQRRPEGGRHPTVVLGGADAEADGLLPEDAGAAQIDAALRAVARGPISPPVPRRSCAPPPGRPPLPAAYHPDNASRERAATPCHPDSGCLPADR